MSSDAVAVYLLLGVGLAVAVGLWARAWGRNPIVWGAAALLMTPFGFWLVAIVLAVRGRRTPGNR
jgi:hypothetical protein